MLRYFRQLFTFFLERGKPESEAQGPFGVEHLVFGIGNIGPAYSRTRHNIGFKVVDRCLMSLHQIRKTQTADADIAQGVFSGKKVAFVKPSTYVNKCGEVFGSSMEAFHVPLESCLVVVDDYNLPLGTIRFRPGGSDGGHNGLKSIIKRVGRDFPRLRIGIGPMVSGTNPVDFVLGAFSPEEETILNPVIDKAVDGIGVLFTLGIEHVMSVYNRQQTGRVEN